MIAIVGIPGSTHHRWKRFSVKADAKAWLNETYAEIRRLNPALGSLPIRIISEKAAANIRYQDGELVYPREPWRAQAGTY